MLGTFGEVFHVLKCVVQRQAFDDLGRKIEGKEPWVGRIVWGNPRAVPQIDADLFDPMILELDILRNPRTCLLSKVGFTADVEVVVFFFHGPEDRIPGNHFLKTV